MSRNAQAINAPRAITLTNQEFLAALAGDDWQRVPISWGAESWVARPAGKHLAKRKPLDANYFAISTFRLADDGRFARKKELFERQFVFVLDDVGTKLVEAEARATLPEPTYILETSPRNFQWGYKLTNGTDARALEALVSAIVDDPDVNPSLKDPGMKGVTRIVRLPIGSNIKPEVMAKNGGKPWPHVMHVWRPEIAYSVETLALWLGVDMSEETLGKHGSATGSSRKSTAAEIAEDVFMRVFEAKEMVLDATPNDSGFISVLCPWRHEHSDDRTDGTGYRPGGGGFQCHHGHCESRTMNDLRQWAAEECAGDFQRAQTEMVREAFERSPIDWDAVARVAVENGEKVTSRSEAPTERAARIWRDGDADFSPPAMLIERILPAKGLTFLGGQSGGAKSFLAVDIGVALASGQKFFGLETEERVGAIYVAAEGAATLPARLKAAKKAREIDAPIPFSLVHVVPDLSSSKERRRFISELQMEACDMKTQYGARAGLIIVDTLGTAFTMRDENSAAEMNALCKAAAQLGDSLDAATLVLAHYGKSQESGIRGSSAIRGAGESVIAALGERNELTGQCRNRRWVHLKSRTGEEGATFHFDLEHVHVGFDEKGRAFGAAKIIRTGKPAATEKASRVARTYLAALETVLRDKGAMARPFGAEGPEVFAADREDVRREFYGGWPADGETAEKRMAAKQKAFRRAEAELSDAGAIGTRDSGNSIAIWLETDT